MAHTPRHNARDTTMPSGGSPPCRLSSFPSPPPCMAAVLTAPGRGALAVVAIQGEQALDIVSRFFQSRSSQPLDQYAHHRIVFGHWTTTNREQPSRQQRFTGPELTEEVVLVRRDKHIEVHCHGGLAATTRIMHSLTTHGCVELAAAAWLAWQQTDPLVAAATQLLTQTTTLRTAAIVLDQVRGALSQALRHILDDLSRGQPDQALEVLDRLLSRSSLGLHLARPWQVTLTGPTNVGKSSLINAILGYHRAWCRLTRGPRVTCLAT